jgi:hypothetical protein
VLATVKRMRSEGATRDEIMEALDAWSELRTGRWSIRRPFLRTDALTPN